MNRTHSLLLIAAFAAGCAAAKLIVPPARAANVQRWEYLCASERAGTPRGFAEDVQKVANQAGQEGWELAVSPADGIFCFKRPLP